MMHDTLDAPGLVQLAASIGGATAVGLSLVRALEHLVQRRLLADERQRDEAQRQELQAIRQGITELQHESRAMVGHLTEIGTILRERRGP